MRLIKFEWLLGGIWMIYNEAKCKGEQIVKNSDQ